MIWAWISNGVKSSSRLTILLFAMLVAAPAWGDGALFPYEGLPIVTIQIEGVEEAQKGLVRSLLDIEPGYLLSSDGLSRGVRRLYSLGRFADVMVRAEPFEKSVVLHVQLVEQARIGEVRFLGDTHPDVKRELLALVQKREAYEPGLPDAVAKRCEKQWETVGYFGAKCSVGALPAASGRIDLEINTTKGEAARILAVEFSGDKKVEDVFLQNEIEVKKSDVFAEKDVKASEKLLRSAFLKRGFLTATVKAETQRVPAGVIVRFVCAGGPRISLKIKGNERFTEEALRSLMKRAPDEPLTRAALDAWRRAVLEKYQARGFSFADVKIESYYEAPKNVVHHVLAIVENERAVVRSLRFLGAKHFTEQRLQDEVTAFVTQVLDPAILSGDVNKSAVRALEDSSVGVPDSPSIVSPGHDHWLYRQDPTRTYIPEAYRQAMDAIRKLYLEQGYTRVEVGPLQLVKESEPQYAGQRTPRRALVNIEIPVKEGPRSEIHVIAFSGTQAIESEALFNLSKLTPGAPYSELLVEETQNEIQKAMAQKGYMYARVEHVSEFSSDLTSVDLRFNITEGPQVIVGRVLVQGNDRTSESVIRDRVALTPGKPYSPEEAQQTKDELTKLEVFGSASAGLTDPEVPAEQKDVLVKLVERDTQSVDLGFGFSTTQGLRGFIEYNERNLFGTGQILSARLFLNQQLLFVPIFYTKWADVMAERYYQTFWKDAESVFLRSIERQARIAWRTPRGLKLPGRPQLYAELINERLNTIPFSLDTFSFLTGVDLKPSPVLSLTIETSIAYNSLQCFPLRAEDAIDRGASAEHAAIGVDNSASANRQAGDLSSCDPRNYQRVVAVVQGGFFNWKTGPTFTLDLRDDRLNPHAGFLGMIKADAIVGQQLLAGAGNSLPVDPRYSFLKLEVHLTGYIPVTKRSHFALSARVGNIFKITGDEALLRAQLNERFFLGGRNTLRGYADRTLLPEDACVVRAGAPASACADPQNRVEYDANKVYTPVPGAFYWLAKGEFRFPVYGSFGGAVFVDIGNLYFSAQAFNPGAILVNTGAGIRYETGVGSLALDIGLNPTFRQNRAETIVPYVYFYFGNF